MAGFLDKLTASIERNDSLLCVGLDPDLGKIPAGPGSDEERLVRWGVGLIEQTADLVCCYKPNIAFYEQYGPPGLRALRRIVAAVPDGLPVLLDAKRGDIGHTAAAYARAAFEVWGADAITVSPYLGRDGVTPFLAYPGKMVFVLCHTSNPSAAEVQGVGEEPLYHHVARLGQTWGDASQVGFVVGATQPAALAQVRALAPDRWLLAPGIGAQGGDLTATLSAGLDERGRGLIVPVSRAVTEAADPRQAALDLHDRINQCRVGRPHPTPYPLPSPEIGRGERERAERGGCSEGLILALHDAGCVQFGEFTLVSGKRSPIYVDLRRVVSYPALFRQVVDACADLARALSFDCLAAVPYAALPIGAALALQTARPLIYPRKEVKAHGTGRAIEGVFRPGDTALVIEDVLTTGGSLIQAIATLEAAGLVVHDAVVLVDREQGGPAALAEKGYCLHAVLTMTHILDVLRAAGRITPQEHQTVTTYLQAADRRPLTDDRRLTTADRRPLTDD